MPSPRTKPSLTSLVAFGFILLPGVYVLSYAPVVRFNAEPLPETVFLPAPAPLEYEFYKPVDWLIDNTLLETPLLGWAGLWGVRDEFAGAQSIRIVESTY